MTEEAKIKFKILDAKPVGSNVVNFRLEDGALVKLRVEIERAAVAVDFKNPDGTPHYNVGTGVHISITPPDKTFYVPRSQLKMPPTRPESKMVS